VPVADDFYLLNILISISALEELGSNTEGLALCMLNIINSMCSNSLPK
jgi:hypothetical protein